MGAAAYNRGSKVIQREADSRLVNWKPSDDPLDRENQQLLRELERAKRSLAVLRLTLTEERRRAREAVAELERTRDEYAYRDPYARFPIILGTLRAKKALGL